MSNIYRHQFVSRCPNNHQPIIYALEIETDAMVRVEHIVTAARVNECAFHELIADDFHARFGGRQVLKAHQSPIFWQREHAPIQTGLFAA